MAKKPVVKSKRLNNIRHGHFLLHSPRSGVYTVIRAQCWRNRPQQRRYGIQYFKFASGYPDDPDHTECVATFEQFTQRIQEIAPLKQWRSSTELNDYYYVNGGTTSR